jgi:hypothetical protein
LHKTTAAWFSICPNITSKFPNITISRSVVKRNNGSNTTCRYAHDTLLYHLSVLRSRVAFINQNMNSKFQPPPCSYFRFLTKNGLIKSCPSFEDVSACKISWSHVDWFKLCTHLRSLNVRHFEIIEAMGLNIVTSRSSLMASSLY